MPAALGITFLLAVIVVIGLLTEPTPDVRLILYGLAGIAHTLAFSMLVAKSAFFQEKYSWAFSISSGLGLGLLPHILPVRFTDLFHIIVTLGTLAMTISSGRLYASVALLIAILVGLPVGSLFTLTAKLALEYLEPFIISVVVMETYILIRGTTQQHIRRLETINKASRQLMQSLQTEQVLALLNATILDTLEADTYFIGTLQENGRIRLDLMYDEGEFFNGTELPLEGTLTGWVIKNQKELFLPDLRENVRLEGVSVRLVGKDKTSLSWIGVPLQAANITGIMAMASYTPNAFDLADLELLSSLAQHATLALDNTIRHAQVEEQARLDSLTLVYNHGYFLKKLSEQAEEAIQAGTPLSLIMLDIDFFKQYNDAHGHLVGDRILTSLCQAIQTHIKQGDAVGRWGGEEFIISLPNATGEQALQVARRIGETMALLKVEDRAQKTVPVPTVSQGIAVFPMEADEIFRLIDLADRRLYIAKERGRNQIEPDPSHWAA